MRIASSLLLVLFGSTAAQNADYGDYQDYADDYGDYGQQDNLYHDYAARQQEKEMGGGGYVSNENI